MGDFIEVEIDYEKCQGIKECGGCVRCCSVKIFSEAGERPVVVKENEDECTLCDLCLEACHPKAITIRKRYED
jgi:ferredoxin